MAQRGGARPNAGRKRKPAETKIIEGFPGHRPVEVLDFANSKIDIPVDPPKDLTERAKQIYINVYKWLVDIDCLKGILPYNLEEYSFCKDRWLEAEDKITQCGMTVVDPKGRLVPSPYIDISKYYLKATNDVWFKIYQVVRETKLTKWDGKTPNDDVLESLLGGNN